MGYDIKSLGRQIFAGEQQAFAIGEMKIVTRRIKVANVKIEEVIVAAAVKSFDTLEVVSSQCLCERAVSSIAMSKLGSVNVHVFV